MQSADAHLEVNASIPQPAPLEIKLNFNPGTASEEVQAIFANPTARKLWCLWKRGHVVSQFFNARCLRTAEDIDQSRPTSRKELRRCFPSNSSHDMNWNDVEAFLDTHAMFFIHPFRQIRYVDMEGKEISL